MRKQKQRNQNKVTHYMLHIRIVYALSCKPRKLALAFQLSRPLNRREVPEGNALHNPGHILKKSRLWETVLTFDVYPTTASPGPCGTSCEYCRGYARKVCRHSIHSHLTNAKKNFVLALALLPLYRERRQRLVLNVDTTHADIIVQYCCKFMFGCKEPMVCREQCHTVRTLPYKINVSGSVPANMTDLHIWLLQVSDLMRNKLTVRPERSNAVTPHGL